MNNLTYTRIISENDTDITLLTEMFQIPEVSRYLNISDNYFHYICNTQNVYFYKIYDNQKLVGSIHLENSNDILFMDILVFPEFQKIGYGTRIIKDIQDDIFNFHYRKIKISIDETNETSIKLFKNAGFEYLSQEDELLNFVYQKV